MDTDKPVSTAPAPIQWLSPSVASEALKPLLNANDSVHCLLVRLDPNSSHHFGPLYQQARYVRADGQDIWLSEAGMRLHNVESWALAEMPTQTSGR